MNPVNTKVGISVRNFLEVSSEIDFIDPDFQSSG